MSTSLPAAFEVVGVPGAIGIAVACYLAVCRTLRWRRYNEIHRRYAHKWDSEKNAMRPGQVLTPEEAQEITLVSILYDMPMLMNYSLAFALFKTYAIPSISGLLWKTKELGSGEMVAKRYIDTEILIGTWMACPLSGFYPSSNPNSSSNEATPLKQGQDPDPRANIAIARTNWLHSKYKISNDDYLYTMALFVLEPITWTSKFGWRALSPLEQHALFTYWQEIGARMHIQDIPDTLEELRAWSKNYEIQTMVPAETNHSIACFTTEELLFGVPDVLGIKSFCRRITVCLLEDRVREAMMYQTQPGFLHFITNATLHSVAFIQKYLCPPRRHPHYLVDLRASPQNACPFAVPTRYASRPWYKPEPKGLVYIRDRIMVLLGLYTEMPGTQLNAGGYRLETMGPLIFEKSGREEVIRMAEEMAGFPVSGVWSGYKDADAKKSI